ncbi:MAG: hypothetical protein WA159_07885, partial [Variovorax sp.]
IPFINKILLKVSHGNVRLFRNSVGLGWVGKSMRFNAPTTFKAAPGDVLIRRARPLHAGLTVGSGDLIGWTSIEITPEMVGQRVAVLTSLEAKEGSGRSTQEQIHWREQVRQAGGIASEVRSVEDAIAAVSAVSAVSAAGSAGTQAI